MELITERLELRPVCFDDKESIFEYRSDSVTNKYQGWIPRSVEEVEAFIQNLSVEINQVETWFQLVIIEKESRKIIGDIGIHFIGMENSQVEIGCTISKAYQKMGYATEGLIAVIDFLFNNLGKHRVIASIDPANINSIRLMNALGFRKEAHFIESLFLNGKWVDDVVYAILKREWIQYT